MSDRAGPRRVIISPLSTFLAFAIAGLSFVFLYLSSSSWTTVLWQSTYSNPSTEEAPVIMAESSRPTQRTPVYFLGIGGPNFMENREHPAFKKLGETGLEITTKVKPKAVVVISAHWQDGPNRVSINFAEKTDLIYDFYNFPPHYYEYKYPNKGSPEIAQKVINNLENAGIEVQKVKRGLDHGVWVGFIAGKSRLL